MMYLQFIDAKGTLKWPQGSCKGGKGTSSARLHDELAWETLSIATSM